MKFPLLEILFHASVNFTVLSVLSIIHEFAAIQFYKAKEGKHRYVFPFENKAVLASVEQKPCWSDESHVTIAIGFKSVSWRQPKDKLCTLQLHLGDIFYCISFHKSVSIPWNLLIFFVISFPAFTRQPGEQHRKGREDVKANPPPYLSFPCFQWASQNAITILPGPGVSDFNANGITWPNGLPLDFHSAPVLAVRYAIGLIASECIRITAYMGSLCRK